MRVAPAPGPSRCSVFISALVHSCTGRQQPLCGPNHRFKNLVVGLRFPWSFWGMTEYGLHGGTDDGDAVGAAAATNSNDLIGPISCGMRGHGQSLNSNETLDIKINGLQMGTHFFHFRKNHMSCNHRSSKTTTMF